MNKENGIERLRVEEIKERVITARNYEEEEI